MQRTAYIFLLILCVCSIGWCIFRDIQIEKQYTGDLRNRIVGARLQKDGLSPYFYKWKKSDGLRYYDPQNFDTLKVSNITASPFLHEMLYPLADLPQRSISKIWLLIEYLLFFLTTAICFSFAKSIQQKWAVIITVTLFPYTTAWTGHIASGQVYLFFPFFTSLFLYCLNKKNQYPFAVLAGICALILLLMRPTTVFFLLPFLFLFKQYSRKYLLLLFSSAGLLFILYFTNSQNRLYWNDYREALKEQVKSHQGSGATTQTNEPNPHYPDWEQWNMKEAEKAYSAFPYQYNQEHGNVFVIINHALHTKMPLWSLTGLAIIMVSGIGLLFYRHAIQTNSLSLVQVSVFAYLLYITIDFFSPVHRFLYYGVQWLSPLLLIASCYNRKYFWIYSGIIAGLLLNSLSIPFIPMENTLGEYIVLLFLVIFIYKYKPANIV